MSGEFTRIARFLAHFGAPRAPAGPGDDCAVIAPPRGELCVTTDSVVEGVHFTRAHFRPEDIGHKALAVNVSDLAAMGASPAWFVCALSLPGDFTDRALSGLARGMSALAREVGIPLVGGNMTSARELSLTLTAAGHVPRGAALLRSDGRPGDVLYVSGTLGEAALGLRLLTRGRASGEPPRRHLVRAAVERQRRPRPQVALGLLARRFARAALDISDGFAQDLSHLCQASRVGARVRVESLPIGHTVRMLVPTAGRRARRGTTAATLRPLDEATRLALAGGEDYELLLAVPPARCRRFEAACLRAGLPVTRVGELVAGTGLTLLDASGRPLPVPRGFDHFARPRI